MICCTFSGHRNVPFTALTPEVGKKGHDFRDYICPDSMEKASDYLALGKQYCRVLYLKDFASYIKDSKVYFAFDDYDPFN